MNRASELIPNLGPNSTIAVETRTNELQVVSDICEVIHSRVIESCYVGITAKDGGGGKLLCFLAGQRSGNAAFLGSGMRLIFLHF